MTWTFPGKLTGTTMLSMAFSALRPWLFIFVKGRFQKRFSNRGTDLILPFLSDNHMMKGVVQSKGILARH